MLTRFDNYNLNFTIGDRNLHVSNIVFEQFKRSIPKHCHSKNSYEIHYIPFGHGHASLNGKRYDIVPNTLFVTGPFVEHEQIPDKNDPMCEYCVYLKTERSSFPSASASERDLIKTFESTNFWFGQDNQDMHSIMQLLFAELEHGYSGYSIQAQALLMQLVVKMVRNYENKKETAIVSGSLNNLIDNKYLIIEECFLYEYQYLTLEKLSSRLGLGIRQTERLLKDQYGKTFLQKKMEARMSAAAILLSDLEKSITDISDALGYSSVEHFSAAFRRYYGMSASVYRTTL